ncbi:MAG: ribosomal protein S18-alanine N-acetyltransferase [candidate division KSB1 bacterium]|nr:ribosomal protein S18-alanine N-acetyltransferase [candidate division KSB1 bacterium]
MSDWTIDQALKGCYPLTAWGAHRRPMRPADLDEVTAIEKRNFHDPWTRRAFLAEIEAWPTSQPLVAVYENQIIGYIVPWFVADELQIANLAVHEAFRRRGLAGQLLTQVCEVAHQQGCRAAHLEVRRSNVAARQFYARLGFQETGRRRHYYSHEEDAILMTKNL